MSRILLALTAVASLGVAVAADPPPLPVIKLPAGSAPPSRSLKYTLLPPRRDLTPGNAASLWRQAAQHVRDSKGALGDKELKWLTPDDTPLKDFPRQAAREQLAKAKAALRLADEAARRADCDWDYPPLTLQSADALPLGEIQSFREIAALLSLRFRLQLAEGKFDDAVATLQTGFALGRHVGEGPYLIQNLVGLAVTAIALGRVEELIQQPGAPNLYWALTALPRPLLDVRRSVEYELESFPRSFPGLREADRPGLTAAEAQRLADEVFGALGKLSDPDGGWLGKLAATVVVPLYVGEARKELLAHGRKKADVEAMPAAQAVMVWLAEGYDRGRDELLKCFLLPPWQALPLLEEIDKRDREERKKVGGTMILDGRWTLRLLSPAVLKVFEANLRIDRHVAMLRAAEAVRLHAATHDDKLPKELKNVTDVPLPLDPRTGRGFDDFYKRDGDAAVLEVPSAGPSMIGGRRFEFGASK